MWMAECHGPTRTRQTHDMRYLFWESIIEAESYLDHGNLSSLALLAKDALKSNLISWLDASATASRPGIGDTGSISERLGCFHLFGIIPHFLHPRTNVEVIIIFDTVSESSSTSEKSSSQAIYLKTFPSAPRIGLSANLDWLVP